MSVKKTDKRIRYADFQNNLWTLLQSGAFAGYSFIIVLIVTRTMGLAEAGVVSFAIAIVSLVNIFTNFSVRVFQGSDTGQEYTLHTYLGLRVCTALFAFVVMVVFLLVSRFDATRAVVILLIFFIFLTDGFADVFMGDLQQKGKMRIAGRMRACSFALNIVAFAVSSFITGSLYISLTSSGIVIFFSYIAWIWHYRNEFGRIRVKYNIVAIRSLVKNVLPFFLGGLIFSYLYNMQKYYLGFLDTDESVAIITMLILPVAALQLLNGTFFTGAEMTKTAEMFTSGRLKDFSTRTNWQLLASFAIAGIFMLCTYTFGEPLLSWMFNTDLSPYRFELMIINFGGAFFAVFAVVNASIIVMRQQKAYLYSLLCVAFITAPLMLFVVARFGITGAAFTNLVIIVPLTISLFVIYCVRLKKLVSNI